MSNILCSKGNQPGCNSQGTECYYKNEYYTNSNITTDQLNNININEIKEINFKLAYLTEDQIKIYKNSKQQLINQNVGK